jgi:gamma-glutamyltranspeptidase/glutathione hydrolase
MSPTIVPSHGGPYLAVGSPGGATIITTVLQILVGRIDSA